MWFKLNIKKNMENQNNEIDLLELSRQMLVGFYYYIKRRAILIIVFAIVGVAVGVGIHLKNRTVYQSSLIGETESIKSGIIIYLVEALNDLNKTDKKQLQDVLIINDTDINNIVEFSADTKMFYKKQLLGNEYIDVVDFTNVEINVIYKNKIDLNNLEKALIKYFNQNSYISAELEHTKKHAQSMIKQIDYEISKIDSLQNRILSSEFKKSNVGSTGLTILNENIDEFFHKDIIELVAKKQSYIKIISKNSTLIVIKPFDRAKIKEKSLFENIGGFFGIFFGIGFLVSIILEMKRKALKFVKKE